MRSINKKSYASHRFIYEYFNGPIPPGMLVRHKICDNPSCNNPNHLELGSAKDNKHDAVNKKRHAHGEKHGNAIFTDELIKEIIIKIYKKEFTSINQISTYYNIERHSISRILNGDGWNHVTNSLLIPLEDIRKIVTQTKYENALSVDKVKDIKHRLKNGETNRQIANIYNVDIHTIYEIKRGNLWKSVQI
jgi:DNA invertase Pin-like site-specific DNA recombinase